MFVFEGGRLDRTLQGVVRDPSSAGALRDWDPIIEGMPKIARETYYWQAGDEWSEDWGE